MNFEEAIKNLGINKYSHRILKSNSRGELFHIYDYIMIYEQLSYSEGFCEWFSEWFDFIVKEAEDKWERPESVFQHIPKLLKQTISEMRNN